jgi:cell division protein FtsQ
LRSNISPWIKYFYYIAIVTFIALIPYIAIQNKTHIQTFKNHLVNKYIKVIDEENDFYGKVIISGNKYTSYDVISQIVRDEVNNFSIDSGNGYVDSVMGSIKRKIEELPWIKGVVISRNLPSDLIVKIKEYEPFAIWQDNDKKYIIDKNGKAVTSIDNISDFSNLLILSGRKANLNANSLFNILSADLSMSKDIYSATWVGSRRWNIIFNNDLLVKLPEDRIEDAWRTLVKIYNTPGSLIDLKSIDLRVDSKVYLQYSDNSIRDLKSL